MMAILRNKRAVEERMRVQHDIFMVIFFQTCSTIFSYFFLGQSTLSESMSISKIHIFCRSKCLRRKNGKLSGEMKIMVHRIHYHHEQSFIHNFKCLHLNCSFSLKSNNKHKKICTHE